MMSPRRVDISARQGRVLSRIDDAKERAHAGSRSVHACRHGANLRKLNHGPHSARQRAPRCNHPSPTRKALRFTHGGTRVLQADMATMTRPFLRWLAPVMLLGLAACDADKLQQHQPNQVLQPTADQGAMIFFDRPRALAAARRSSLPMPLVVLVESDPWLGVIGSDSPAFALYADGTALYRTEAGYKSVRLDSAAQGALLRSLSLADLSRAAGAYQASDDTDQPRTDLLVYAGDEPFYISIYGNMAASKVRARMPDAIVAAYDILHGFKRAAAQDWLPDKVEVMLGRYDNAPEASIVWPKDWPGLDDPSTRKRHEDQYSLFLPATELGRLRKFLATRHEKGAVLIGGKKWSVGVRLPFAHEELWMPPKPE
jgi:hypothetical protein